MISGELLLCFSKEIYLFLAGNGNFQPWTVAEKTCCLLSTMSFYNMQRSGAGGALNWSNCIWWKRQRNPPQQAERVWHDLCGCVQFSRLERLFLDKLNTSVTGTITILMQHVAPQSWSLWTRVLWATDATENEWCRDKNAKKVLKKSLHGDTFLTVPWNHCQGSCIRAIYFVWV